MANIKSKLKQTALIVGRFHPFHLGHLKLIQKVAKDKNIRKLIIGIGSSQFHNTQENPFSAKERREMIEKSLKILIPYQIVEIPDIGDDKGWVSHVKKLVGEFDIVYANGDLEKKLFQKAGYEVKQPGFFQRKRYAGTEIRRRIITRKKWENLVPEGTREVMKKIKAEERIKKINSLS